MPNALTNEIARREPTDRSPAWIELEEVNLRYETSSLIAAAAGSAIAVAFAARQAIREGMSAIVDDTLEWSWPPAIRDDRPLFQQYRAQFLANDPDGYAYATLALSDVDLTNCLPALIPGSVCETVPAGHLMAVQRPQDVLAIIHAFRDGSCA